MKYAINEMSSLSWDFERDVRFYAEVGAPAITVVGEKMETYGREEARKLLAASGLEIAAYSYLGPFELHDRDAWDAQLEACRAGIGFAAELGAPVVEMLTGGGRGHTYPESERAFLSWLDRLLPIAEQSGVTLAFENNHALRVDIGFIHMLHDALDLAEKVDSPQLRVCCEINNAWIERHLLEDIRDRSQLIAIIQINDFAEGTLATPERVPVGDGIIPLRRIFSAFERAGYDGYYELELIGPEIERLGYEESIRRSISWLDAFEPG